MKRIVLEGVLVAVLGAALSFAANAISPRGLKLSRNYFPTPRLQPISTAPASTNTVAASLPRTNSLAQLLADRLRARGIGLATSNQVAQLFHDPRRDQELVIFVDARDDEHYQAGHIPGAYQLDYYRPEKYLLAVIPACQIAQQILVYCNGGDCEDSELTAALLQQAGITPDKLMVYGGGMSEWSTNSMPVETGTRRSGQIRNRAP